MLQRILILVLAICLTPLSLSAQKKDLNSLLNDAAKAARKNKVAEADSLYQAYVDLYKSSSLKKNFTYSDVLIYLARRASNQGKIDRAIELQKEVAEVRRTAGDCNNAQWASAVSDLATYYAHKSDFDMAIKTGEEALAIYKKEFGEKHFFYNITLSNIASFYSARGNQGDYEKAVSYCEQALKHLKKSSPEYASALNGLVVFYSQAGQIGRANEIAAKAKKEAKKRLEEEGIQYATVLNNQAIRLANIGNYPEAIEYAKDAKECFEMAQTTNTMPYAKVLTNLATFYAHQQNYQEAEPLLQQAMPIIENLVGKGHPDYIRCMSDLSAIYKSTGNLSKADELANESDKMGESLLQSQNLKYAKSLSKQGAVFASNGNYTRAMEHEQKALQIFLLRKDSVNIATSMGLMATYLFNSGKVKEALASAARSLDIFRNNAENSIYFAQALNNTSILHYHNADYAYAAQLEKEALELYEFNDEQESSIYAKILANLALYNFMADSTELAIEYTRQAIEKQKTILGEDHPDNVPLYYNIAVFYSKIGDKKNAEDFYTKALDLQANQVRTNFLHLTSNERERYWNAKQYVFKYAPTLAYLDRENSQMVTDAYNSLLFMKGILLNSDIDFRNLLRKSNNEQMLEKFNRLSSLYEQKDILYKLPASERGDMRQLNNDIYSLERELVRGCKEYGSFTDNLGINAANVAKNLQEDEAAVEFTDIDIRGIGRTYVALYLRKGWTAPKMLKLFSESDLNDTILNALRIQQELARRQNVRLIYDNKTFGKQFWQPLISQLDGVRNIYFSPSGMLYQLGVEYLYCDDEHRIGELYNVCRLSSTKSLAQRTERKPINNATVYGGLEYDMDLAQLKEQHERMSDMDAYLAMNDQFDEDGLDSDEIYFSDESRALDSLTTRGSVIYLPGTLHEAENIVEELMMNDVETTFFSGKEGIEESFKALNGRNQELIHIATHGFYISENDVKRNKNGLAFVAAGDEAETDNSLNFSGLLLSGANYTLRGNRVPKELEDGVLTAKEIAQVDLSGAELVVLSACQTGLGEVKEDGVFGIQRGFKKAGAKSLMMSLWSVSDKATDLMMTTFYSKLMEGMSKQQAFHEAQQTIRRSGFDDPYFWAAFILLDGAE